MSKQRFLETAKKMADTVMKDNSPIIIKKWQYDCGLTLLGIGSVYEETNDSKYFDYIKESMDYFINEDGTINTYNPTVYNIDHINNGKDCFWLYNKTGEEKYIKAVELLKSQLKTHPRTESGAYFHKLIYPNQIWLDGLFMGEPFCAQYAKECNHPENFDDIVKQFVIAEKATYEPRCGLYAHACDESKSAFWADKATGRSLNVWGRSCGWFCMAIVDVLDFMPEDHPGRQTLIDMYNKVISNVVKYQDESGVWYQVLDNRRSDNYKESTCSCMFAYSMNKAIKMGYIDEETYKPYLLKAVDGIFNEFIRIDGDYAYLKNCCAVAGLGPDDNHRRDGSLDYYFSEPITENDCKGVGPFLLLATNYIY